MPMTVADFAAAAAEILNLDPTDTAAWVGLWTTDNLSVQTLARDASVIADTAKARLMFGPRSPAEAEATVDLGALSTHLANITGAGATITSLGTSASADNPVFFVRVAGVNTLTHNATSLVLPGGADITTAAGDKFVAEYLGDGNWEVWFYFRISGALLGAQPLNSNLTAISALTTATFGRSLLAAVDAGAGRALLGAASASDVTALESVVDALVEGQGTNAVVAGFWTELAGYPTDSRVAGDPARVVGADAGTHTDPVVGGTVANRGIYAWSASPAGWKRVGNLESDDATGAKEDALDVLADVTALATGFVIDPDGQAARQQLTDRLFSRIADQRARASAVLDGLYGDDAYSGASTHRGGKKTVAGLLPKILLTNSTFVKVNSHSGVTLAGVYKVTLDKGANRPRNMQWAIFRNDPGSGSTNGIAQHFAKVESIVEVDTYTIGGAQYPAYYDPTPGQRVSDVYFRVFDKSGVPGNPITDEVSTGVLYQYYAQLTVPSDGVVAVRAGSAFKGGRSFDPQSGFQALVGVGRGNMPVFDCMKTLGESAFELSAHADAGGVVYQTTEPIVAEDLMRYLNDAQHNVIMTDPDGRRYPMEIVTSVAACAAKRGTVYFGTPGAENTNAHRRMHGAILFINPRWGKNPTDQSDGTTYEHSFTARSFTLTGANGATDLTNTHQGQTIEGIVCIAGADGQGPIENEDTIYRRICSEDGGKHNLTIQNGRVEDCTLYLIRGGANGGDIPMQGFAVNVAGLDIEYSGLMIISPDHWRWAGTGLYCHGNVGTELPLRHDISRYVSYNGWGVITASRVTYINDALFLSGPIERTATTLAAMNATLAGDPLSDRDVVSVTTFDSGNQGQYVWREDLATPALEKLPFGGTLDANVPNANNLGVKTYIRRAIFDQVTGPMVRVPSSGSVPDSTSLLDIRDSFFKQRDGYSRDAIQPNVDITYKIVNNIILLTDAGISTAWNPLHSFKTGSEYRLNIIMDFRTATGGGMAVAHTIPGAGVWDYNVYCMANTSALSAIYVSGAQKLINSDVNFAAYKDYVASYGMDANSVLLRGDAWQDLFVGDPRTGDLRLRADCDLEFADGQRVVDIAGIRHYRDWNKWAVLDGQQSYTPIPPKTRADCRAATYNPYCWNWRDGQVDHWALTL